jgi:hypothetical protein
LDSHLLVPKDEPKDNKGIHLRGSNKKQLRPSKQKQKEPVAGDKAKQVNKARKGKTMVNCPSRSKIRETNKFRLNSKSLFNPSLKEENVIEENTKNNQKKKGHKSNTGNTLFFSCFSPLSSRAVYETMEMNYLKPKEVFVGNGPLHKNLSRFLHNYHSLRGSNISLRPIFQRFHNK